MSGFRRHAEAAYFLSVPCRFSEPFEVVSWNVMLESRILV